VNSIVIPAHNEEALIGATLDALAAAFAALPGASRDFEVIVVDDDSSDRTGEIARAKGARVVPVKLRQIGAVRNAGAAASRGDLIIFVDADTIVPAETLRQTLALVDAGAIAGGAPARLPSSEPLWARAAWKPFQWGAVPLKLPGGAYMFATRQAFDAVGGFDLKYFAAEEIHFARALKRIGRFSVVRHPVVTSGRKFRLIGFRGMLRVWTQLAVSGPSVLKDRTKLGFWYDKHRD
jgi:glycosyltransferase involved in cell wall biosynthesis